MFSECPHRWKLNYVDKLTVSESNIHLIFGTAMHEVLQKYLNVMYNDSVKNADLLPLDKLLKARMVDEYNNMHEFGTDERLVTQDQMEEFYPACSGIKKNISVLKLGFMIKKHSITNTVII